MGIREDMEMLKFLQQAAATNQGNPGQMSPMMQPSMGVMPQEGMQSMQDMQEMQQAMQPQQQQQMPQAPQKRNPLEAGSRAAVDAAKRSLEMNANENRRALGRAIMGMMSGIGKSSSYGKGIAGNLGAINAGFAPALSAYDAERDRIMNLNYALSTKQKEEAALARKEDREMKKMSHEMDMAQKNLKINEGYLGLKQKEVEHEKALEDEMTKAGASVPLGRLSAFPSMYNKAMDKIQSYIDKGDASIPALQSINTIENILTNDPDVTKHWGTILLAAQRKDPTLVHQYLANKVPERTRINAELLSKSLSTLGTSKFKGVPARGLTAFAEKMLIEGSPSMGMDAKSILKMIPNDKKYFGHNVEARDAVYENLEKGIAHTPKPMKLELEKFEDEAPASNMTPEQAEARKAQIRAQLGK